MIIFDNVFDVPIIAGNSYELLAGATIDVPQGRYALLMPDPQLRRPVIDLLAGLRPPIKGAVSMRGRCSWPIGRAGFVRGRLTGRQIVDLISRVYRLDPLLCNWVLESTITEPQYLDARVETWPPAIRQEFSLVIALLPRFDIYIIDNVLPHRKGRFIRLWSLLFQQRLTGATLILSTVRANEAMRYCQGALIVADGKIRIEQDLDRALLEFPVRISGEVVGRDRTPDADIGEEFI